MPLGFDTARRIAAGLNDELDVPGQEIEVDPLKPYEGGPGTGLLQTGLQLMAHGRARANAMRKFNREDVQDRYTSALTDRVRAQLNEPEEKTYPFSRDGTTVDLPGPEWERATRPGEPGIARDQSVTLPGGRVVEGLTGPQAGSLEMRIKTYERVLGGAGGAGGAATDPQKRASAISRLAALRTRIDDELSAFGAEQNSYKGELGSAMLSTSSGDRTREEVSSIADSYYDARKAKKRRALLNTHDPEIRRLEGVIGSQSDPEAISPQLQFLLDQINAEPDY